jgi:hypothetical protein
MDWLLGLLIAKMGLAHFPSFGTETRDSSWISISFIAGLGLGFLYPDLSFAVHTNATLEDLPMAASLFTFFEKLGQTLGVAKGGQSSRILWKIKLSQYPSLETLADSYIANTLQLRSKWLKQCRRLGIERHWSIRMRAAWAI